MVEVFFCPYLKPTDIDAHSKALELFRQVHGSAAIATTNIQQLRITHGRTWLLRPGYSIPSCFDLEHTGSMIAAGISKCLQQAGVLMVAMHRTGAVRD